jgi:hypothetical protein
MQTLTKKTINYYAINAWGLKMFRTDKPKKSDSFLGICFLGIQEKRLYNAWLDTHGVTTGYIFKNDGAFFVRGTKEEKAFAEGFFNGWKKALTQAGDNPWRSANDLPEGPTRRVMLYADLGNGFEVMFGSWTSVQQQFAVGHVITGLTVKYWKEILGPE